MHSDDYEPGVSGWSVDDDLDRLSDVDAVLRGVVPECASSFDIDDEWRVYDDTLEAEVIKFQHAAQELVRIAVLAVSETFDRIVCTLIGRLWR